MTRKITRAVAKIALGLQKELYMGNLDSKRDWGHAKDYVKAMWLILQQEQPEDFVIATGVTTQIRDFIQMAFTHVGFNIRFEGEGLNEVGILDSIDQAVYEKATGVTLRARIESNNLSLNQGEVLLKIDPAYFRPTEVDLLVGDPTKSKTKLGWTPEYNLKGLVEDMMASDLNLFQRDMDLVKDGH